MGLLRYYYTTSNFANLRLKLYPLLLLVPGHRLECLTAAWADQQTMGTRNQGRTSAVFRGQLLVITTRFVTTLPNTALSTFENF